MSDTVSPEVRSRIMRAVPRRSTKPELDLRRRLHAMGFRYRIDGKDLPGSPDIVLPKYCAAIFVHGCFWHRHPGCRKATTPKTRAEFWSAKFARNQERDREVAEALKHLGWRVCTVWECELKGADADVTIGRVVRWLRAGCTHRTNR